ncbi:MAG: hypothetical protein LKI76_04340 [Megasphaera sp.]|jgi:hypothetical protein|nr:hypothetical protein [Megasphaera sp.]
MNQILKILSKDESKELMGSMLSSTVTGTLMGTKEITNKSDVKEEINKIVLQKESIAQHPESQDQLEPGYMIPCTDGTWKLQPTMAHNIAKQIYLTGERFQEKEDGVYAKRGDQFQKLTNCHIVLISKRSVWDEGNETKYFRCQVFCDAWGNDPRELEVEGTSYKDIFEKIRSEYQEISISRSNPDALDEYLSIVFQNDINHIPAINEAKKIGWTDCDGQICYLNGSDKYYVDYSFPNQEMIRQQAPQIFSEGVRFLQVGHNDNVINILFLGFLLAYSLFWLQKGHVDFHQVFYLRGDTNLLKSSTMAVIANIFQSNRERALSRITSTPAGVQREVAMLPDNFQCFDDFSNTEVSTRKKAIETSEVLIRAYGDGVFPTKCNVANFSETVQNTVRNIAVLIGEENIPLGRSSFTRMIILLIEEGTFDGSELDFFQSNPQIMRNFAALYISFLTEHGHEVVTFCKSKKIEYRDLFNQRLKVRRSIDSAVALNIQSEILDSFASWCGMSNIWQAVRPHFRTSILETLQQNEHFSQTEKPELRFLKAFMAKVRTKGALLAENESIYVNNEDNFIGFYEHAMDTMWVRFDEVWKLVKNYYLTFDESWLQQEKTIKRLLVQGGFAVGKIGKKGESNVYLMKSKKEPRRYMLVLNYQKVKAYLDAKEKD